MKRRISAAEATITGQGHLESLIRPAQREEDLMEGAMATLRQEDAGRPIPLQSSAEAPQAPPLPPGTPPSAGLRDALVWGAMRRGGMVPVRLSPAHGAEIGPFQDQRTGRFPQRRSVHERPQGVSRRDFRRTGN